MLQQVNIDKYGTVATKQKATQAGQDPDNQLAVMLPVPPGELATAAFADVATAFAEAYGWEDQGPMAATIKLWATSLKHLKDRLRAKARAGTTGIPSDIEAAIKTANPATIAALRALLQPVGSAAGVVAQARKDAQAAVNPPLTDAQLAALDSADEKDAQLAQ